MGWGGEGRRRVESVKQYQAESVSTISVRDVNIRIRCVKLCHSQKVLYSVRQCHSRKVLYSVWQCHSQKVLYSVRQCHSQKVLYSVWS